MINPLELKKIITSSEIKINEKLSNYSFTKTGGKAEILVFIKSNEDFINIIKYCNNNDIPITILGNGSNILISDEGIKGITVITTKFKNITLLENNIIKCNAGSTLKELSDFCINHSLTGLEFSCGIPGSVGGAIYMNAGAYGGEMKDVVTKVETIDNSGSTKIYTNEEMKFDYRHSIIQENKEFITTIYFSMSAGNRSSIEKKVDELNKLRAEKQPLEYPSCGSVFKRPVGYFAGKLIQEAGCQGHTIGGAQVSTKHAGFIININKATCQDYKNLISYVQEKVFVNSGIKLECEVKIIGEEN